MKKQEQPKLAIEIDGEPVESILDEVIEATEAARREAKAAEKLASTVDVTPVEERVLSDYMREFSLPPMFYSDDASVADIERDRQRALAEQQRRYDMQRREMMDIYRPMGSPLARPPRERGPCPQCGRTDCGYWARG